MGPLVGTGDTTIVTTAAGTAGSDEEHYDRCLLPGVNRLALAVLTGEAQGTGRHEFLPLVGGLSDVRLEGDCWQRRDLLPTRGLIALDTQLFQANGCMI